MREHLNERKSAGLHQVEAAPAFDAEQVIAESVAALAEQRAAWRPADLQLEIARRLPSLGGLSADETVQRLHELTEQALASTLVRQVSGRSLAEPDRLAESVAAPVLTRDVAAVLAEDPYTAPSSRLYASTDTLAAEEALRRAAIERGGHALETDQVRAWLDEHVPTISADQAAAVIGLATTDARLAVLVGPAGAGKSFGVGAFAQAWADLTAAQAQEASTAAAADGSGLVEQAEAVVPGRVMGLAVGERATRVLKDDGLATSANIAAWLGIQDRLAEGSAPVSEQSWRLRPTDVVLVDEASMVTTADLTRIRALAEQAGARVVLTGDPRQLGAVEAGGVMGLLDKHAETYTLSEVRRFSEPWEAAASLRLRDSDQDVLDVYDRRGRLLSHDTHEEAITAAATAAVADRVDGRSVVVVAGSNAEAAEISAQIRAQLIDLGLVDAHDQVALGKDGATAGIGDLIVTRQNDYKIGVYNRGQYTVTAVGADGSLTVTATDQPEGPDGRRVLPAEYVDEHVQLGYAATVHASQGLTVDSAHLVTGGGIDAATTYVGMTRGRLRNTAHVSLRGAPEGDTRPTARAEASGKEIRLHDEKVKPSARVLLEQALAVDATARAATVEAELDAARLSSMDLLAGRYEAVVRAACRERLDRHLDQLAADGVLDPHERARLAGDLGSEHLARLLRAVEQTGRDPRQVLADAVATHSLTDAKSPAQVLAHRINPGHDLPLPAVAEAPQDIAPEAAEHLELLQQRMQARQEELAQQFADRPPAWALEAFGPVPEASEATVTQAEQQPEQEPEQAASQQEPARDGRAEWLSRVGVVAGHREAIGWEDEHRAIGVMPGLSATERRASHAEAWQALGQPQEHLDETAMSEGRLRVRIRAAQQELGWAPAHADDALRAAETEAETHRQEAALARARADAAKQVDDLEAAQQALEQALEHEQAAQFHAAAIEPLARLVDTRDEWSSGSYVTRHFGQRALAELGRRGIEFEPQEQVPAEEWLRSERAAREADDAHRQITETDVINHYEAELSESGIGLDTAVATEPTEAPAGTETPSAAEMPEPTQPTEASVEEQAARLFVERGWGQTPAQAVVPQGLSVQELTAATVAARTIGEKLADQADQNSSYVSDADRDAASTESYEAGRRRRDTAESSTSHGSAAAAGADVMDMS
nr:AAA family ATPase [Kineosporia rhizophila]